MKKKIVIACVVIIGLLIVIGLTIGGARIYQHNANYDFHHTVPPAEAEQRIKLVRKAEEWLGAMEGDEQHKEIVDLYNAHTPLAQGYEVKYKDDWCATFVSTAAIQSDLTHIIPTECGCQRQIGLFQEMDCWVEDDNYIPLPGDIIYYCMKNAPISGDCNGWADHVGIVVGTNGNYLKVIEGNYDNQVTYRYLSIGDRHIRGYAVPRYGVDE